MPRNDLVETETPIFTQEEVYMIAGYLADIWNIQKNIVDDIDKAVQSILNRERG